MDKRIIATAIVLIYIIVMIVGATMPSPQDIPVFGSHTKYFHFIGFMLLSLLVLKTLELYGFRHAYILGTMIALVMVYLTESLQLLVPTRHFSYMDMLIDIAGIALGMILYRFVFSKVKL